MTKKAAKKPAPKKAPKRAKNPAKKAAPKKGKKPLKDMLPKAPQRLADYTAVWSEMKDLAGKYGCLSLGEGAPNLAPPKFLLEEMNKSMQTAANNQYGRSLGHPILMNKVAEVYGRRLGKTLDPMKNIVVGLGANGALASFISALCNKGDEVVTFCPMFPMYIDHIEMSGAKMNSVPLEYKNGKWVFDPKKLKAALSRKQTKVLLINTPHNPTGKVFSREEMQTISDILDDCPQVVTLSDEVYDFLAFDGLKHISFATVGNNWDRTVSIFSGGKMLNCTGWKVGWAIGPTYLIGLGSIIANSVYYTFNMPSQVAIANSLDKATKPGYEGKLHFSDSVRKLFIGNRDYLTKQVAKMDMPWEPLKVEGGYFLLADVTKCAHLVPKKYLKSHDYEDPSKGAPVKKFALNMPNGKIPLDLAFCRWMACENGVAMMPGSFCYGKGNPNLCDKYVRMAICKD